MELREIHTSREKMGCHSAMQVIKKMENILRGNRKQNNVRQNRDLEMERGKGGKRKRGTERVRK